MKVLVIGGTGYIGGAVSRAFVRSGHAVHGVTRTEEGAHKLVGFGAGVVRADLRDPRSLVAAVAAADAVVWAATTNEASADADAVQAVLGQMQGTGKAFVYTSGVWVHGDTRGRVGSEDSPLRPIDLVSWRPAVERAVLGTRGVRAIVIRPGIVYGSDGGIPRMLVADAEKRGAVRMIGSGENRWPVVFIDDLADLYVRAVEKAVHGTVLLAVHGDAVPLKKIAAAASEAAGLGGGVESWPLAEARKELGAFADALALDQQLSAERAREQLGWQPRGPGILEELRAGSYVRR